MVDRVDTVAKLAQWRIDNFGPSSHKKSDPFKLGIWNWHFLIVRNRFLHIHLFPEPSRISKERPPLARFILRVSVAGSSRKFSVSPVYERLLRTQDDFSWPVDTAFSGRFIIDVEFLDLKICSNNISVFDGNNEDAYWWVLCTDKFFREQETPESAKMLAAAMAMRGRALTWWRWWYPRHPWVDWNTFTIDFIWRFKSEWRDILPTLEEEEEPDSESFKDTTAHSTAFLHPPPEKSPKPNPEASKSIPPTMGGEPSSIWSFDENLQPIAAQSSALSSLSRMLDEAILADLTIITADGTLRAHKAFLSASSPVFQSMFHHNLKEKESSTIHIEDMSLESCTALLSYFYGTIKQEDFRKHRLALLAAANKYDIGSLKDLCEESLLEDISSENVIEMLNEAWLYQLHKLKKGCLTFLFEFGKIYDVSDDAINNLIRHADRELVTEMFREVLTISNSV